MKLRKIAMQLPVTTVKNEGVILRGRPNISGVTGRGSRIEISNDESREFSRYRRLDTDIYIE